MPAPDAPKRKIPSPSYWLATMVIPPWVKAFTRREWQGVEHIPRSGGMVAAPNHVTLIDPLIMAYFLWDNGHPPYFLAKEAVFRAPVVGRLIRGCRQIPVYRETADAGQALAAAIDAVGDDKAIVIYPEGSTTKDPARWPMRGKTGAARVALSTGCPLIPIGQWGTERILPRGAKRPDLRSRHLVRVRAGAPVDLTDLADPAGGEPTAMALKAGTDRLMGAITGLVEDLRGDTAPAERFNPDR